jgi:ADP-L-glycero-D-manno-heptose 6-epimerase
MTNINRVLITGSSGFIGSCLIDYLINYCSVNRTQIDICDINPKNDYSKCNTVDPYIALSDLDSYSHVIHLGAESSTNQSDSDIVYQHNIKYTTTLLENLSRSTQLINASSASLYKTHREPITELYENEKPNSLYSFSKWHIDNLIRNIFYDKQIISLRFFNVCSFFSENHKSQPSPTFSFLQSIARHNEIKLFHDSKEIYRDFIYITDVLDIIYYFMNTNITNSEIINVGCGQPVSFYDIASELIKKYTDTSIVYIDKPTNITTAYQYYTHANINKLRLLGYNQKIPSIIEKIQEYVQCRNISNYKLY